MTTEISDSKKSNKDKEKEFASCSKGQIYIQSSGRYL
jgi:hypothetical protein